MRHRRQRRRKIGRQYENDCKDVGQDDGKKKRKEGEDKDKHVYYDKDNDDKYD